MKKKKISLRKIILLLMILGCLTSAVAIILTSYSSLQLMNQNNIEDNMKMNICISLQKNRMKHVISFFVY